MSTKLEAYLKIVEADIDMGVLGVMNLAIETRTLVRMVRELAKAAEDAIPKCHTGARMIDVCLSDFHDNAHVRYGKDPINKRDYDLANALAACEEMVEK